MGIIKDSIPQCIEYGSDLTIASGQSISPYFDLIGYTLFGIVYPNAIDGYYLGIDIAISISSDNSDNLITATTNTYTGVNRSIILCKTSPTSATYGYMPIEPAITGGVRRFRVYTADSSNVLQTQSASRTLYVVGRKA